MKRIAPGDKIPLKLTTAERSLIREILACLPTDHEKVIRSAPSGKPIMMTLDDLDDLAGHVAAESNHTTDKKLQKKLDAVFRKIQRLLNTHTDEKPSQVD